MVMAAKKMVNGNAYDSFHLDLSGKYLYMKNCILSVVMFLGTLTAFAQQDYFIYLQADNRQPFYVRLHDKIYSSAASGYLVLSQLPDSTHSFIIGFPQNAFPEQEFTVPQNHKDGGYLLKNFGDKGWGLFNLQSLAIIMNNDSQKEKKSLELAGTRKDDSFSLLLSNAVNDTAILYTTYKPKPKPTSATAVKEEKKDDTSATASNKPNEQTITLEQDQVAKKDSGVAVKKPVVKKDNNAVTKNKNPKANPALQKNNPGKNIATKQPDKKKDSVAVVKEEVKIDTAAIVKTEKEPEKIIPTPPPVLKAAEVLTDTSYIAVFIDEAKENNDTVRISIPFNEIYTRPSKNPYVRKPAADSGKHLVKNNPANAEQAPLKDSVRIEKEKQAAVITDTASSKITAKNDTQKKDDDAQKKEEIVTNPATPVSLPAKDSVLVTKNTETLPVKRDSIAKAADTTRANMGMKPILINSDCKATAWDSDIDKLRVKMLAASSDDDKIDVAKKLYKLKCLTVKQVRALSELFTTDQARYKWLDAVYPFTTNSYYFPELEDLLKDEYFRNRFKAMVRH